MTTTDGVSVKTPHLCHSNRETNTNIIEDYPGAVDLKSVFTSPVANSTISKSVAISIGRALGSWVGSFYTWASAPAQAGLRTEIEKNEPMRKLKYVVTYDSYIKVLENFLDILEGNRKTLEDVREMALKEVEKTMDDQEGEKWEIIHGDFWTGK
jgi:hypothetical protein